MSGKPLYVGIDLGTTNSSAVAFDGEQITLVRNAQGSPLTPSVVRIDAKGTVTVGARARRALETDPGNTRAEFKRLMGTAQKLTFDAAQITRLPEELAAEVLRSLLQDTREQLGVLPECAVVTVPALFELPQSSATAEAARLAGLKQVEMLQEPVASALAAGWTADAAGGHWLVYDLGGGTFDVSLLETRDGLLRVVAHDGDNFLGGRDFNRAIVDWASQELFSQKGIQLDRAQPAHAVVLRRLKYLAEEAKLDLTRGTRTELSLEDLEVDGRALDVVLELDRARLETLCAPLIDRSIAICQRLLATYGIADGRLGRIVLVGGPTAMPFLRARVSAAMGAPFGEGLDPMTLVAQGAAIYAASAGLDARPAAPAPSDGAGPRLWLQYPAMSSDLTPFVLGRRTNQGGAGPQPTKLQISRADGAWQAPEVAIEDDGTFVCAVSLVPHHPNVFRIEGRAADGSAVAVQPETFTIVQGVTISDPPLSRSIGIGLANDAVQIYVERGAPLPARRTFQHKIVDYLAKGSTEVALRVPIVQGEFELAHLCRLVGTLEIQGGALTDNVPAGSLVEVTLDLDRGGRLSAHALIPATNQTFEQVARLIIPDASPEGLAQSLEALRKRLSEARAQAFRAGSATAVVNLPDSQQLGAIAADLEAARGGDADAGQKARRAILELEATLEEVELATRWPEIEQTAIERLANASSWVSEFGTPTEQTLLEDAAAQLQRARQARQPLEMQRQLRVVRKLSNAAFHRHPQAWEWMFDEAASRIEGASDLKEAQRLVKEGREALGRKDTAALRPVVERLWALLPSGDATTRQLGYNSGVR